MNFFKGHKVELRRLTIEDCTILADEQKDSSSTRLFGPGIINIKTVESFEKLINEKYSYAVEDREGNFVGTVHYNDTDEKNGVFDYGIMILQKYHNKGNAKDAVRLLLRFGFYELRFQKANSDTLAINNASIKLQESLGFVKEGTRRRTVYTDGKYLDEILFGMTREEFDLHNSEWMVSVDNVI